MHLLEPGGRKLVGLASPPEEEGADVAITPASSPQKACSLYSPSNSLGGEKTLTATVLERKTGQWKSSIESDDGSAETS